MSVKKEPAKGGKATKYAILFELENITFNGRDVVFGVIEKVFKSKDVKILPHMYSRFGLYVSLSQFVSSILEFAKKKTAPEKLVAEIKEDVKTAMLSNSVKANAGMQKIIKRAEEEQVSLGAWSALDEQTAKSLLVKAGASEQGVALLCSRSEERPHISADAWLKLAKNMGVPPALCLAVATCKKSCKAALTAGMKCVVVPDKFTSFQDFGGVDLVAEKLDGELAGEVFNLLKSS